MSHPAPTDSSDPSGHSSTAGRRPRSSGRLGRLALKELRETLRDRRTILTLVLMPVLVYPLLSIAFQRFLLTWQPPAQDAIYHVAVDSTEAEGLLRDYLLRGEAALARLRRPRPQAEPETDSRPEAAPRDRPQRVEMEFFVHDDLAENVADGTVDLAVRIESPPDRPEDQPVTFELIYASGAPGSEAALDNVHSRLEALNVQFVRRQLRGLGISTRDYPVQSRIEAVEPTAGAAAFSLGVLVPLILILMTITGAVYPAIDLTAGERERGTLEALIAAPVPRMGLLFAKYIAVLTVALLTAAINLSAMTVTIFSVGLDEILFGERGLSGVVIAQVLALLVLFAGLFSAAMLALTSFARSFKEAQAYLIPLMLVSLAPGMLSLIPDLELGGLLAVVPLANIVLLARDLFEARAEPLIAAIVIVSTALYALAALGVAARLFGSDAILYGSQGTWSDLLRRPAQRSTTPTVTGAMLCLALLFPAYVLLPRLAAQLPELSVSLRMGLNGLITILLFGGFPLAAAWINRISLVEGFRLKRFSLGAFVGSVLLGLSLWTFAFELVMWAESRGLGGFDLTSDRVTSLVEGVRAVSPAWLLLTMAVIPAVFEEFFFRGFLLNSLRTRMADWQAILVSALLFGLFHLIVTDGLTPIRFLPSTLLGLVLGWVFCRTGSVFPGMILHACHNGFLLLMAHRQHAIEAWLETMGWQLGAAHIPPAVLAAAAIMALAGAALIARTGTPAVETPSPEPPDAPPAGHSR